MDSLLLTGATGLIGRRVASLLHASPGAEMTFLTRSPDTHLSRIGTVIPCDLAKNLDVSRLPETIDAVIHLAQPKDYRAFPERSDEIVGINVSATISLAKYAIAAGASRFVHASTGGVYAPGPCPLREADTTPPIDEMEFFQATKFVAESLLAKYRPFFTPLSLRFFFVYGPGQREANLFPRLIASVKEGREITLAGEHGVMLTPCYVDDAATSVIAAACGHGDAGIYNIAGPEAASLEYITHIIGSCVGREPKFTRTPVEGPAKSLVADTTQMRRDLSVPSWSVARGIFAMVAEENTPC